MPWAEVCWSYNNRWRRYLSGLIPWKSDKSGGISNIWRGSLNALKFLCGNFSINRSKAVVKWYESIEPQSKLRGASRKMWWIMRDDLWSSIMFPTAKTVWWLRAIDAVLFEWIEFHNGSTEADNVPDVALESIGTNMNNVCTNGISGLDESTTIFLKPTCQFQDNKDRQWS